VTGTAGNEHSWEAGALWQSDTVRNGMGFVPAGETTCNIAPKGATTPTDETVGAGPESRTRGRMVGGYPRGNDSRVEELCRVSLKRVELVSKTSVPVYCSGSSR
jgi:hypothetical protein